MGKVQRKKRNKKLLAFYHGHFGVTAPFYVLTDPDFVSHCVAEKRDVQDALAEVLGTQKVTATTTQCCVAHLRKQNDRRAVSAAKKLFKIQCGHMEGDEGSNAERRLDYSKAKPPIECLKEAVGPSNKKKFVLASGERKITEAFKQFSGMPKVICSKGKGIFLKEPPAAARKEAESELRHRLGISDWERAKLQHD